MTDLLLDKQRVVAVLDPVGDVGPAQRVELQRRVQADGVPIAGEAGVQALKTDPRASPNGHRARPVECRIPGRTSLIHSSIVPGVQRQTVSTLRRLGGDPFLALP
ncbi:hypothetical protein ACFQL8_31670 [Streptomyces goshikiensis]|uniref:hypothetical protein n=1 Tax=Streptomyces goshikiensis TaxID=1942 RepID=UPI00332ED3C2